VVEILFMREKHKAHAVIYMQCTELHSGTQQQSSMQCMALQVERLMVYRETIAVDYENHMKHINTLCGQTAEFQY
jgi:hypothetical protein